MGRASRSDGGRRRSLPGTGDAARRTSLAASRRRRIVAAALATSWTLAAAALADPGTTFLPVAAPHATPVGEEAPYVEGMVVVRFVETATEEDRQRVFDDLGAHEVHALPWKGFYAVAITRGTTAQAIRRWEKAPTVASIEPNGLVFATGPVPDDPEFLKQWHLRNVGQPTVAGSGTPDADIDAPMAWCLSQGDPRVVVATLDTGVRYDHPDLAASIFTNPGEIPGNGLDDDHNGKIDDVRGWDFENHFVTGGDNDPLDTHGHGTLVAGLIAAAADGQGSVGVAPGVTILPIRVLTDTDTSPPSGTHLQAALGIRYAVEMGARVINCSFGSFQPSSIVEAAIQEAATEQIVVVCGAGNSANDNDLVGFYPASFTGDNVISVTATDPDDGFAENFANYGVTSVDLAAPGVAVWGTIYRASNPYDLYGASSGTSFAAPLVSGAIALFESFSPGLEHPTSREALLASVDRLPPLAGLVSSGGRLNVHRMLVSVAEPDSQPPATIDDLGAAAVGTYWIDLEWTAPGDDGYAGTACCYDIRRSLTPIGSGFADAEEVIASPPSSGGSLERFRVGGLDASTTYYFAIRTRDEAFGESSSSNELVVTTLSAAIEVTPRSVEETGKTGQVGVVGLQLSNPSGVDLTYSVTTQGDWLSATPDGGAVPPGDTQAVQLTWDAHGIPGVTVQGAVEFASNAVGAPIVRVPVTLAVSAAPDIDVAPLALDLGTSYVGHGSDATLTIRNLGFRALVVDDITSDLSGLSVSPASFSLGPGSERDVLVSFVPDAPGSVSGTVSILSNDPFELPLELYVSGTAVTPPVLDLSVESVVAVGITGLPTEAVPVIVRNLQTDGPDLELSLEADETSPASPAAPAKAPAWLTLDPTTVTVPPGGNGEVLLRFSTTDLDPGLFTATIGISSNDPDRSRVNVPVSFDVSGIADLVFEAAAGAFGPTTAGTFRERIVPIANAGNDTLIVKVRLSGPFSAGPPELRIPPGGSGNLSVRYRPTGNARDAAMLRLFTNDPSRPFALLPVTGQGRESWSWSGTVRLDRRLEVPAGNTLTIEAGTRLEACAPLGPGNIVSPTALDVRGRLVVSGTEEEPVELGTNEAADWEGVVVLGEAELRHAVVAGARTGVRAEPGAVLDVACSRVEGNDVGLSYAGRGGATGLLADTRWENRVTNLRVDGVDGLELSGTTGSVAGRNVFVVSDDPGGGWNLQVVAPATTFRLHGNVWLDARERLWSTGSLGAILATIDGLSNAQAGVLPLLETLPLPCGQAPEPPPPLEVPAAFSFARSIPNPIRSNVTVDFDLPAGFLGLVIVDIFDVRGARVRRLVEKYTFAGRHSAMWDRTNDDGRAVTTGLYFMRLETADYANTRKVLVLR